MSYKRKQENIKNTILNKMSATRKVKLIDFVRVMHIRTSDFLLEKAKPKPKYFAIGCLLVYKS